MNDIAPRHRSLRLAGTRQRRRRAAGCATGACAGPGAWGAAAQHHDAPADALLARLDARGTARRPRIAGAAVMARRSPPDIAARAPARPAARSTPHHGTHHERLAQSTDRPTETSPGRRRNAKARTHKTRRYTGA